MSASWAGTIRVKQLCSHIWNSIYLSSKPKIIKEQADLSSVWLSMCMLYFLCFLCYALSAIIYLICFILYALSAMLYLLCVIRVLKVFSFLLPTNGRMDSVTSSLLELLITAKNILTWTQSQIDLVLMKFGGK